MSRYRSEKQRRDAEQFKHQMVDALDQVPEIKQEAIADGCEVTQPTVSRWFSYAEPEFPDLFQLSRFPVPLLVLVTNLILKPLGLAVTRPKPAIRDLNGRLDDNLLNIDVIQAEIIRVKDKDPHKAKKYIEQLRKELDILDAECDRIISGGDARS